MRERVCVVREGERERERERARERERENEKERGHKTKFGVCNADQTNQQNKRRPANADLDVVPWEALVHGYTTVKGTVCGGHHRHEREFNLLRCELCLV